MKTRLFIAAAMLPLLAATYARADEFIATTKHNFSSYSWSGNQICKPCHTPHNGALEKMADGTLVSDRLWNHTLSQSAYTLHAGQVKNADGSTTLDAGKAGGQADMDRVTRLCLSCHDGTVALDAFGGAAGNIGTANFAAINRTDANLGTDLTNDHPVGTGANLSGTSTYYRVANLDVSKPGAPKMKVRNSATESLPLIVSTTAGTYNIGCMTCHNPHGAGPAGGAAYPTLLRTDNTGSNLCLSCHMK
ncbi:MAG TPA: cytochrome c3 family protein [Tepidisphaeraceae bacterium]|jgi:predicted CXXCH cytochrome family protein